MLSVWWGSTSFDVKKKEGEKKRGTEKSATIVPRHHLLIKAKWGWIEIGSAVQRRTLTKKKDRTKAKSAGGAHRCLLVISCLMKNRANLRKITLNWDRVRRTATHTDKEKWLNKGKIGRRGTLVLWDDFLSGENRARLRKIRLTVEG